MFPLLIPMLIGAGVGALSNRKDPLKGGLLGAGMGAMGGAGVGLLGGAGAAGGSAAGAGASSLVSPVAAPAMGSTLPGLGQYATGYTAQGLLGAASQYAKPASQMASIAQQSGLLDPQQQQQPMGGPLPMPPNTGAQTLGELAQAGDSSQQITQESAARKKRRAGLLGVA